MVKKGFGLSPGQDSDTIKYKLVTSEEVLKYQVFVISLYVFLLVMGQFLIQSIPIPNSLGHIEKPFVRVFKPFFLTETCVKLYFINWR